MKNYYAICDRCDKIIYFNTIFITTSRMVEKAKYSVKRNRIESNPLDAIDIVALCEACGNILDEKTLSNVLKKILADSFEKENLPSSDLLPEK